MSAPSLRVALDASAVPAALTGAGRLHLRARPAARGARGTRAHRGGATLRREAVGRTGAGRAALGGARLGPARLAFGELGLGRELRARRRARPAARPALQHAVPLAAAGRRDGARPHLDRAPGVARALEGPLLRTCDPPLGGEGAAIITPSEQTASASPPSSTSDAPSTSSPTAWTTCAFARPRGAPRRGRGGPFLPGSSRALPAAPRHHRAPEELAPARRAPSTSSPGERPELTLVLAGSEGWGPAPEEAIAASPNAGRLRRLGYVADGDVAALLRCAAVVAYPSKEEGFGLPALEALACGAPLVTSEASVMAELAGRSPTAPVDDVASLAAALAAAPSPKASAGRPGWPGRRALPGGLRGASPRELPPRAR